MICSILDDLQGFEREDDFRQLFPGDQLHYIDGDEDTPPAEGRRKRNPRVAIPGRGGEQIYKSTLVSMLNQDPNLSHDRYPFNSHIFHFFWTSC